MDGPVVAVVTGDVNASSRLDEAQVRRLGPLLAACFEQTRDELPDLGLRGFTAYRGDAWQFAVTTAAGALRATLHFRAVLLERSDAELGARLQTSAALGFGPVKFLPDDGSTAGAGAAFEASGRRLDRIRRRQPGMGVAGLGDDDAALDVLAGLVDALVHQWTPPRARAVALALQGLTQEESARRWQPAISQQAVHKHLQGAGWPAIDPALRWAETTLEGCFSRNNPGGPA